jgi:sulfur carrier protein ThiS
MQTDITKKRYLLIITMNVYIERSNKQHTIAFRGTGEELCKQMQVNPQTVLILKDGELVTEDVDVSDAEEVKLITVVSGG